MKQSAEKIPVLSEGRMKFACVAAITVALVASGSAYYFRGKYMSLLKEPEQMAAEETANLLARVGRLMVLPSGEAPTVATVSDPEKLRDQTFFANAQIGFKVLIYANAKKAILYDPLQDKIVEVAPVNIGNP